MSEALKSQKFASNVKWQLIGSVSQSILGALVILILGRELGAHKFGIFSIVMGYIYVTNSLLEPRMQDVAAKQFCDFDYKSENQIGHANHFIDFLAIEILLKIVPCVALVLCAKFLTEIGNLSQDESVSIVVAAIGIYFAKLGNGLATGFLRVLGRSDINAVCVTGELFLRLVVTLLLIRFATLSVNYCIILLCVSGVLSNIVLWVCLLARFDGLGLALRGWRIIDAVERIGKNRRLLVSNMGLSVSDIMSKDLDVTLIAPLISADQVGVYKLAKNFSLLTWRAIDPFFLALMPEISRLISMRNYIGVKKLIIKSSVGLFVLALILSIGSYSFIDLFGNFLLGMDYLDIPKLMMWMLIGVVVGAPLIWGHPLAVAINRADVAFAGSLFGSILGLGCFLLFTPVFGVYGSSSAWAVTFVMNFTYTATVSYYLFREKHQSVQT